MTLHLNMSGISPRQGCRNALIAHIPPAQPRRGLDAAAQSQLLRSVIGRAAALSDTPEKWAETVELLRRHGVDPVGFEDFQDGRPAAIAASGVSPFTASIPDDEDA